MSTKERITALAASNMAKWDRIFHDTEKQAIKEDAVAGKRCDAEIMGLAQTIPARPSLPGGPILSFVQGEDPPPGIKKCFNLTGGIHDRNNRGDFGMRNDVDAATKDPYQWGNYHFTMHIPDPNESGVIMLDREGTDYQGPIKAGSVHPNWTTAVGNHEALINWVRRARPLAPVCLYAHPDSRIWDQNDDWRDAWLAYPFEHTDLIMPSVYKWWVGDKPSNMDREINYVRFALELGKLHNLPVYLMTTHRYTKSSSSPQVLIPEDEWVDYVTALLETDFQGKRCSGLAPWGSDPWYYNEEIEQYHMQIDIERGTAPVEKYLGWLQLDIYANCETALAAAGIT